jgi:hypothetical protein
MTIILAIGKVLAFIFFWITGLAMLGKGREDWRK